MLPGVDTELKLDLVNVPVGADDVELEVVVIVEEVDTALEYDDSVELDEAELDETELEEAELDEAELGEAELDEAELGEAELIETELVETASDEAELELVGVSVDEEETKVILVVVVESICVLDSEIEEMDDEPIRVVGDVVGISDDVELVVTTINLVIELDVEDFGV